MAPRAIADLVRTVTGSNGSAVKIPGGNGSIPAEVQQKLQYDIGVSGEVDGRLAYRGVALSVRQKLIDAFNKTQKYWRQAPGPPILPHQHRRGRNGCRLCDLP